MALAVDALHPIERVAVLRLRLLQVAHVLRDDRQILQALRDAGMIIAENTPIYLQSPLVSLLGEIPLLIARVHFGQIVQDAMKYQFAARCLIAKSPNLARTSPSPRTNRPC